MTTSPGRKFYKDQIDYLVAGDIDNLIDNHYNEDAVLVGFDFTIKGREALKRHFHSYLGMLGEFRLLSTDKFAETEDTLFFEATVEASNLGEAQVYNVFVLKDGKASYHFTGVK